MIELLNIIISERGALSGNLNIHSGGAAARVNDVSRNWHGGDLGWSASRVEQRIGILFEDLFPLFWFMLLSWIKLPLTCHPHLSLMLVGLCFVSSPSLHSSTLRELIKTNRFDSHSQFRRRHSKSRGMRVIPNGRANPWFWTWSSRTWICLAMIRRLGHPCRRRRPCGRVPLISPANPFFLLRHWTFFF